MEITFKVNNAIMIISAVFIILLLLRYIPFGPYFQCVLTKVDISLLNLILMKFRKVQPSLIVNSLIVAQSKNIRLNPDFLEAHYLAGGNVRNLTEGIIYAKSKGLSIENNLLAKAELLNKNLKEIIDKYLENKTYYGDNYSIESLI